MRTGKRDFAPSTTVTAPNASSTCSRPLSTRSADADTHVVYQATLTLKRSWRVDAEIRTLQLKQGEDTWGQRFFNFIFDTYEYDATIEEPPRP